MINYIQKTAKSKLLQSIVIVATGTAGAQAIAMIFAPFITRLYGPEIYGLQGIFLSIVFLLSRISALGYPTAIVLPKLDIEAAGLVRLSIYISVVMTIVVSALVYMWGDELTRKLKLESIGLYIYMIPLAMLFSTWSTILSQWLIRKKMFKLTAKYYVYTTLILSSIKTAMGFLLPTAIVLISVNTFGTLINTIVTYFGWSKKRRSSGYSKNDYEPKSHKLSGLAYNYRDFPILRTPQNLINAISQSLPVLMLAWYYGTNAAGQYSIAISLLAVPMSLIGGSVASVFYPRITEAIHNGENVRALIVKATVGMAATGAIPYLVIIIAGPSIFKFIFGDEWQVAGEYAQWLSLWVFMQCINKPAIAAIPALKLQGGLLIYELFSTGTKILALWIGFEIFQDAMVSIALFANIGIVAYLWLIFWVVKNCKKGTDNTNNNATIL